MVNKQRIFIVFGISGVGKTTLIKEFISNHPGYKHVQAGDLLGEVFKNKVRDNLRRASEDEILSNQYILVEQFKKFIHEYKEENIIFDGHSIIDSGQNIIRIPADIFEKMDPYKIIFIWGNAVDINSNRMHDPKRSRPNLDAEIIDQHQEIAYAQAKIVSTKLRINLIKVRAGDLSDFRKALEAP